MANSPQATPTTGTESIEQFDAIIIGAGVTGLHQLYRLRQLGLSVRVYDELGIGIFFQMLCEDTSDIFLRCREGKLAAEEICNRTLCRVTMPIN